LETITDIKSFIPKKFLENIAFITVEDEDPISGIEDNLVFLLFFVIFLFF
jgi:hypothetical protein